MNAISRRQFTVNLSLLGLGIALGQSRPGSAYQRSMKDDISLATWSMIRSFREEKWKMLGLPKILRDEFQINAIEFVNTMFEVPTARYLDELKKNMADYGVTPVLIMIDREGDLSAVAKQERMQAVRNHRKWVDIAAYLGCHAVRCNTGGKREGWDDDTINRAAESFAALLEYASQTSINIILENHGGVSSDPKEMTALMEKIDSLHFGTLPDFGNFPDGTDKYDGIRRMLPYAKGVSVKTYFNSDGTHTQYDLDRMLKMCVEEGYHGYWGIESETRTADEYQAIRWSKEAIDRVVFGKG